VNELEIVDVVVIGGGSAGICAAIAAARSGVRVVLIEKSGMLGGMGSLAMVHTFCGLYLPDTSAPPVVANRGLPEEIEMAMRERTGQGGPIKMGRVYVLPQQPEIFDSLAKEMVAREAVLLSLHLQSDCTGVIRDDDGSFTVTAMSGDVRKQWQCRSLVDCSANAIAAQFLNVICKREEEAPLQRPSFIFALRNVEAEEDSFRMRLAMDLVHAVGAEELPAAVLGVTLRSSPRNGEVFVSLDLDTLESEWDPESEKSRDEIGMIGRSLAFLLHEFLRSNYPSFHKVSAPRFPEEIGVRESCRWLGKYTLTSGDLLEGRQFDDAIAYATWPIELRETTPSAVVNEC